MTQSPSTVDGAPVPAGLTGRGFNARILLMEDSQPNREATETMLGRLGHTHDVACDGQEALARIDRSVVTGDYYDLILMDARTSRVGGEAMRELRASGPYARTPIIGLAPSARLEDIAACFVGDMDTVLPKPVRIDELRLAIETVLTSTAMPLLTGGDGDAGLFAPASSQAGRGIRHESDTALHAERRAEMLGRLSELVGGGDFAPDVLEEIVALGHELAASAGMCGDPATGDLAYALEQCVRGFAEGGETAIRAAAAALHKAA